ncbi:MAG: hypothetical protein ACYC26_17725 [Phycisphaerales bacterium]
MPWLYELGVEVYRVAKQGTYAELQEAAREFRQAVEFAVHGPMSREFFGRSKEMSILMEEIDPLLDRALDMINNDERHIRRKSRKEATDSG